MLKRAILATLMLGVMFGVSEPAYALNCGMDYQHVYEKGVRHGRADGSHLLEPNPLRHGMKYLFGSRDRGNCYADGYNIGYQNAYADATKRPSKPSHDKAPTPGSNERAYYDDGCHDGTADAQMSMSMAYERHSDMYDRRFEPFYKQGYEHCWKMFR
jgi:hypothetical protein